MNSKLLSVLGLLVVLTYGCKKPDLSGSGSPPSQYPITIDNPQYGKGVGSSTNWNQDNDPNYTLKVKVQTLDANNNATLYKSYSFTYTPSGRGNINTQTNIEVPSSGMFVIQADLDYSECTWQFNNCNPVTMGSNKEYFVQQTFMSPQNQYYLPLGSSNIILQNCVCN